MGVSVLAASLGGTRLHAASRICLRHNSIHSPAASFGCVATKFTDAVRAARSGRAGWAAPTPDRNPSGHSLGDNRPPRHPLPLAGPSPARSHAVTPPLRGSRWRHDTCSIAVSPCPLPTVNVGSPSTSGRRQRRLAVTQNWRLASRICGRTGQCPACRTDRLVGQLRAIETAQVSVSALHRTCPGRPFRTCCSVGKGRSPPRAPYATCGGG